MGILAPPPCPCATQEYIDDGMTGFCPKPVKKAFLMNVLWTVLGDARRKANKARAMEKDGEAADANSLSPTPRSSGVSQPAPKTGQNVLLIEQNMLTQMLLKRFFTKLGVKCDYCNSLSDGLQQLAKHKYQVSGAACCTFPLCIGYLLLRHGCIRVGGWVPVSSCLSCAAHFLPHSAPCFP